MLTTSRSRRANRRENSRANDRADSKKRELDRSECTLELEVWFRGLAYQLIERFSTKKLGHEFRECSQIQ
jgi:hypothetical protein